MFWCSKISDIFGHRGISDSVSGMSDDKLFDEMLDIISRQMMGILFLQTSSNSILYMVIGEMYLVMQGH